MMRVGMVRSRRTRPVPSMMRHLGLRRARLGKRWSSEGAYLFSNPANVRWIMAAIAQLDEWRESSGTPPFDPRYADGQLP